MNKYKVLQRFLTKTGLYQSGDWYEVPEVGKFTKNLVKYGFVEKCTEFDYEAWEKKGIKSKLANVIIAPMDYAEGDKKHFNWEEACALEKKLNNGWRLPTRSEWTLICEEFGQKNGALDTETLMKNLSLGLNGRDWYDGDGVHLADDYGFYWSSTPRSNGPKAYSLNFYSTASVYPSGYGYRQYGRSVRLVKETSND